jgi:hypothetical protein
MSGKIFPESTSLYEDQAKILFDYFHDIAERIVSQEEEIEKQIAVAREEQEQFATAAARKKLFERVGYGVAGLLLLVAIALQFAGGFAPFWFILPLVPLGFSLKFFLDGKAITKTASDAGERVATFEQAHKAIPRDFRVHRLGVGYIPIAGRIPFEERSFLLDYTGLQDKMEFRLSTVREQEVFTETVGELDSFLASVPVVESAKEMEAVDTDQYSRSIQKVPYYDYFAGLDRRLRTLSSCLGQLDTSSVEIPVVMPNSEYANFLAEYAAEETGSAPLLEIFNTKTFDGEVARFHQINKMRKALERHSQQFEQVLRSLMVNIAQTVEAVTQMKVSSTNKLIEQSNRIFYTILKASYNHYSPKLEAEEIERIRNESFNYQDSVDTYCPFNLRASSRVRFDAVSNSWMAEDGSRTGAPFGMQQLEEEIIAPVVQALMQSTRQERMHIYHNIVDQKTSYLNKWHQDTEDFYGRNRAQGDDLINLMRSSLTDFIANYNTLQALEKTENQMAGSVDASGIVKPVENAGETLTTYEAQRKEFEAVQDDFNAYMDRLKEEIDRRAEKFRYVEFYDASLRDHSARAMSQASNNAGTIDARRRPLLAVNPLYAETSELAPAPAVEDLTEQHFGLNLNSMVVAALRELDAMRGK